MDSLFFRFLAVSYIQNRLRWDCYKGLLQDITAAKHAYLETSFFLLLTSINFCAQLTSLLGTFLMIP